MHSEDLLTAQSLCREKWGDVGCQGIGGVDGDGVYHLHKEPFQDLQSRSTEARRLLSSQPNQSPSR